MSGSRDRKPIVVKVGGSTLGSEDTTLEDTVQLHRSGHRLIIVHGGGAMITDWLERLNIPSIFIKGLRSTNKEALDVVIAVLRGIVNTHLVAEIERLGGRAVGLSGVDGGMIRARRRDERLGFVGEMTSVNREAVRAVLQIGAIPVIAPIGLEPPGQPLNINADTVAGEIARALGASRLIFLTDVDGILSSAGALLSELDTTHAEELKGNGILTGGMIPKVDASIRAAERGVTTHVANGRVPRTLQRIVEGESLGTRIEV